MAKGDFNVTFYRKGALDLHRVAIVGDRQPSPLGVRTAEPSENPEYSGPVDGFNAPHLGRRLSVPFCPGNGSQCNRLARIHHLTNLAREHCSMQRDKSKAPDAQVTRPL